MANTTSAKKASRQATRRTTVNRTRVSQIRSLVKKVEEAIASGNRTEAQAAFKAVQPALMRGVSHDVVHKNAVARKLSRLSKRIKALA